MNLNLLTEIWYMHSGKIIGMALGFVIGILVLTLGFFKTLFILLCVGAGYFLGKYIDNNENPKENFLNALKNLRDLLPSRYYR